MSRSSALGVLRLLVDGTGLLLAGVAVVWSVVPESFESRMVLLAPYFLVEALVYALVALAIGVNRSVWRFTSLEDLGVVALAITIAIVFSLGIGFVINRLDGVFRSLPLLQGALAVLFSWAARALFVMHRRMHLNRKRRREDQLVEDRGRVDHILIVGVNELANLYIGGVAEFADKFTRIAGLLSQEDRHKGRLVQQYVVLGRPVDVLTILAELRVHGVNTSRIVVAMPFQSLTPESRAALLDVETRGEVELVLLDELLALHKRPQRGALQAINTTEAGSADASEDAGHTSSKVAVPAPPPAARRYLPFKRMADFVGAIVLTVVLIPVAAIVSLLVFVNDGTPLLFWQLRPGRGGRPLRVFKFRTMIRAHRADGTRTPDVERTTTIGRLLRRARLDELPQLYHVLVGEMSFIGPRPLLPADQNDSEPLRLSVRPGITGYAQVCGCNRLSVSEKMLLDAWYVENLSPSLDISILFKTVGVMLFGEHRDEAAIERAIQSRRTSDTLSGEQEHRQQPTPDRIRLIRQSGDSLSVVDQSDGDERDPPGEVVAHVHDLASAGPHPTGAPGGMTAPNGMVVVRQEMPVAGQVVSVVPRLPRSGSVG